MSRFGVALIWLFAAFYGCGQAYGQDLEPLPVKYVGNAYSSKFHIPSCPFAEVMYWRRKRNFHYRKEAEEAGYKPCCWCLPKRWKHLEGRLLVSDYRSFTN